MFQQVYFCNVHREDDKVTKWIRENYTPEFFGGNYELAIVAARIFNRPETLERISNAFLPAFDPVWLLSEIEEIQEERNQVWSGAYLISTCGAKMPKALYCVQLLDKAYGILPLTAIDTCQRAYEVLMKVDGLGSFLSAQIVADLKNTRGHALNNALDRDTFSAPGPGSLRGLAWYHDTKITPSDYDWAISKVAVDLNWEFCMQDLQNCLCEFDKYCRVRSGEGRSKRKYNGGA